MKLKEYGAWPPYGVSGDNPKYSADEYNRDLTKERFDVPDGYASKNVDEYYQPPRMQDAFENLTEKKEESKERQKARQEQKKREARKNMLRQVTGVLVGSVIVVTTYQAVAARQNVPDSPAVAQPENQNPDTDQTIPEPIQLVPNWKWSDDKQTVILELLDSDGNLIKEIPATISISEKPATCNKEGQKTYTATVEDEGKRYSDSQSEPLPPLGHAFDGGKETVLENGKTVTVFECTRCHEQFTFETSMTEID